MSLGKIKKHLKLKQAMEAMINKDYKTAIDLYSEAIASDPNDWKVYVQRCNCFQKLERLDEALNDAQTAIDLSPTQLSPYFRKGLILLDKKQFRSAEKSFQFALNCNPTDQNCRLKLKETHRLLLEEFGFKDTEADLLVNKYTNCSDISDDLISGKLVQMLAALQTRAESVTSAESPRVMSEETVIKTNDGFDDFLASSLSGSLPDFNNLDSTVNNANMSVDGEIRKPNTRPLFRKSVTPMASTPQTRTEDSLTVVNGPFADSYEGSPSESPPPKSRMIKTKPKILRTIKI